MEMRWQRTNGINRIRIWRTYAWVFLLFATASAGWSRTDYVDKNAAGPAPDCSSWTAAYATVQEGLTAAANGDEVWVARGTYGEHVTVAGGVALYGGFAGTETERSQQDAKQTSRSLVAGTTDRS
jgi:hypothetical protein